MGRPGEVDDDRLRQDAARFSTVASSFVAACIDRAVPRDTLVLLPPGRLGYRQQRDALRFLGYGWHLEVDAHSPRGWFFMDDGTVQHSSAYLLADGKREAFAGWLRGRPPRTFVTGDIWVVDREDLADRPIDVAYVSAAMHDLLNRHPRRLQPADREAEAPGVRAP